jgi:monooxygenase
MTSEHFDVLIIGAGLSGIGAAYRIQTHCPDRTYLILEARERLGGTWDLFRYPGVRSDSDMYTLAYPFQRWQGEKEILDGPSILRYLEQTAVEHGIDRNIRFNHHVRRASWSTQDARWTLEVAPGEAGQSVQFTCNFLLVCSGYYRYDAGYLPQLPGMERFAGRIVHPQQWSDDVEYAGKRVVVIGSGATAVTLVPALARTAAHVTMLQRSPSYVVRVPSDARLAKRLKRVLPDRLAYTFTWWGKVIFGQVFFALCRRYPDHLTRRLLEGVRIALGASYNVGRHFTPRYNPWEQRLCVAPDGDFFRALKTGRASVVTDQIEGFTPSGLRLASGAELAADVIVTATGLVMLPIGGIELTVDGTPTEVGVKFTYKGVMVDGIPNFASVLGYTNASWTLKSDLLCRYVCRLLNHMRAHKYKVCVPLNSDPTMLRQSWANLSSGYIQRAEHMFPKIGSRAPWKQHQDYLRDLWALRFSAVNDGVMRFKSG